MAVGLGHRVRFASLEVISFGLACPQIEESLVLPRLSNFPPSGPYPGLSGLSGLSPCHGTEQVSSVETPRGVYKLPLFTVS